MILNKLSEIMGKRRINMSQLSRMTGLSRGAVFNIYHEKTSNIDFETMDKLCRALKCSVGDLFEFVDD